MKTRSSFRSMSVLLLFALLLVTRWGWRASFVAFGAVGIVWAIVWHAWYRDRPDDHPAMTRDELAWIQQDGVVKHDHGRGTPWRTGR